MNVNDLLSLKGKVILVTGGAGNYGRCIVEGLAEADGTVIIASRNMDQIQKVAGQFRSKGLDVHAMQVDQGEHFSVITLKEEIIKKYGKLDVFVNNAVSRPMKDYDDSMENFAESMRVNATGMMDILREICLLMEKNRRRQCHQYQFNDGNVWT